MQSETTTAITAAKKDVRLREWAEQLEAQQTSGLTVTMGARRVSIALQAARQRLFDLFVMKNQCIK